MGEKMENGNAIIKKKQKKQEEYSNTRWRQARLSTTTFKIKLSHGLTMQCIKGAQDASTTVKEKFSDF